MKGLHRRSVGSSNSLLHDAAANCIKQHVGNLLMDLSDTFSHVSHLNNRGLGDIPAATHDCSRGWIATTL